MRLFFRLRQYFCWHRLAFRRRLKLVRHQNWVKSVPVVDLYCRKCGVFVEFGCTQEVPSLTDAPDSR